MEAACRGYPPDWWSLDGQHGDDRYKMAHRICQFCPVKTICLQDGVDHHAWGVIMGGRDFTNQPGRRKTVPAVCVRPNCRNPFDALIPSQRYCSTYCRIKDEKRAKTRRAATVTT